MTDLLDLHTLEAKLAEVERERDEALFRPMGDNHHNAAKCPYCRPDMASEEARLLAEQARVKALEEALRKARYLLAIMLSSPIWKDAIDPVRAHIQGVHDTALSALKADGGEGEEGSSRAVSGGTALVPGPKSDGLSPSDGSGA